MRTEDQIDAGAGPLDFVRFAIESLENLARAVGVIGRLPLRVHVEQIDEEVVRQRTGLLSEDAVLRVAGIRAKYAQATDQYCQFGRRQPEQLRLIDQLLLSR